MIKRLISRLCNADKRETLITRLLGNVISVGLAQKLGEWTNL